MTAAAAVCTVILGTLYVRLKKKDKPKALTCKALATLMPTLLLLRAIPSVGKGEISALLFGWTFAALAFYIAADVLLECRFVLGALTFSAGHLCMIFGFLTGGELSGRFSGTHGLADGNAPGGIPEAAIAVTAAASDPGLAEWAGCILLAAAFAGAACFAVRRHIPHLKGKRLLLPAIAYVVILSVMASLGVTAGLRAENYAGLFPALGGIAFVVSDILLGLNRLGRKRSQARGAAVLSRNYLAVYRLSMRVWVVTVYP